MRIVGGRFRSRLLKVPPGRILRPTADRTRESLFNILAHGRYGEKLEGGAVLDVFAGSGALGFEALSRGAEKAAFIDNNPACLRVIAQNAALLGVEAECRMHRFEATRLPEAENAFDLVFLDPPYNKGLALPALRHLKTRGWIAPQAICVIEMAAEESFAPPARFLILDERTYGAARVVFLEAPG